VRRLNDGRPVSGSSRTDCLVAMDDRYMGFATRDELVPALNELLDAERAGASVTLQTAKEAPEPLKSVVMSMQRDEARWRGAPTKAIQHLHGRPSPKTGAFYGKAMTIPV
jgi:nitronate monooxygenase